MIFKLKLFYSLIIIVFCLYSWFGKSYLDQKENHVCKVLIKRYDSQMGEYVVETFEDRKGNLWFGTLKKGVAKFNGKSLKYFTTKDGLPSNRIVSIIEDNDGNLWFATDRGISKYDGNVFINFSEKDGLCSNMVSYLFIDSKGNFWVGTWGGVCKLINDTFKNFPIPYPKITTKVNPDTKDWITCIAEDDKGNIWFGRDGYGVSKFNGFSFVHFTTKEGLHSNNVQSIVESKNNTIWIGTRVAEKDNLTDKRSFGKGGLNMYDGQKITHFPRLKGLNNSDVFSIYKDSLDNLWISTTNNGVYFYKDGKFINYKVPTATVSFLKDKNGTVWLGSTGGLYKITKGGEIKNFTLNGPWD